MLSLLPPHGREKAGGLGGGANGSTRKSCRHENALLLEGQGRDLIFSGRQADDSSTMQLRLSSKEHIDGILVMSPKLQSCPNQ